MESENAAVEQVKEIGTKLSGDIKKINEDLNKEIQRLEGQMKESGRVSDDTANTLKGIEAKIQAIEESHGKEISALATRLNRNDSGVFGQGGERTESLKSQIETALTGLVKDGFGQGIKDQRVVTLEAGQKAMESKAVGDMSNSNLTGYADRDIRSTVQYAPVRPVRMREIISVSPMTAPILEYPKETTSEGGVGFQTEGSAKSQIDFDFQMVSETPKTIAVFARLTKQSLQDIKWLSSHLAMRLGHKWFDFEDNQVLNGNNTGQEFNGLITQGTDYTKTADTGSTYYEYLADAIAQLENTHYTTSTILINPLDFVRLVTYKADGSGEFTHPGLIYGPDGIMRFFGVPIVKTSAIARLTGLVGDFREAELAVRESINFAVSYDDGNNFTTNKVTYRLEGRETLAVYDPSAFRVINFAEIAS